MCVYGGRGVNNDFSKILWSPWLLEVERGLLKIMPFWKLRNREYFKFTCPSIHRTIYRRPQIKLLPRGRAADLHKSLWSDVGGMAWLLSSREERRIWCEGGSEHLNCAWLAVGEMYAGESAVLRGKWTGLQISAPGTCQPCFFNLPCIHWLNYKKEIMKPIWAEAISAKWPASIGHRTRHRLSRSYYSYD